MKADIVNLVKLQKLDDEIRALESRLARIPKEIDALEKEIAAERKALADAEELLAEAQKAQRAHESDLSSTEERLSKFKDQLMNVKTNDEYKAMQKQIESTRHEIGDIEERILLGMDRLEELEAARKERAAELEKGQKEITGMENELKAEESKVKTELSDRQSRRENLLGEIPDELLSRYDVIAKSRGGVAMAEAVDELCQVCRVRLRPQVFQEVRIGETIHTCGSCSRILYYREEQPTTAT